MFSSPFRCLSALGPSRTPLIKFRFGKGRASFDSSTILSPTQILYARAAAASAGEPLATVMQENEIECVNTGGADCGPPTTPPRTLVNFFKKKSKIKKTPKKR